MVAGFQGTVTITGGREIARALARIEKSTRRGLARGAVGEGAKVIRDVARGTARAVGLGKTGVITTPSGNTITLRGKIPGAIESAVERSRGDVTTAKVYVSPESEAGRPDAGKKVMAHWILVEFGSVNNRARPFLRPALIEGAQPAVAAIVDVLRRGMRRYNKPGG